MNAIWSSEKGMGEQMDELRRHREADREEEMGDRGRLEETVQRSTL